VEKWLIIYPNFGPTISLRSGKNNNNKASKQKLFFFFSFLYEKKKKFLIGLLLLAQLHLTMNENGKNSEINLEFYKSYFFEI
jgi:hypothetical protein